MTAHLPQRRKNFPHPTPIPDIERMEKLNIRGITVSHMLTFHHHHISALITKCSRSLCALKIIRARGLYDNTLWDITRSTLVSQLQYASRAWWGYLKAEKRNRLQSIWYPRP